MQERWRPHWSLRDGVVVVRVVAKSYFSHCLLEKLDRHMGMARKKICFTVIGWLGSLIVRQP